MICRRIQAVTNYLLPSHFNKKNKKNYSHHNCKKDKNIFGLTAPAT